MFFATSSRFPGGPGAEQAATAGVPVPEGITVARGTDGKSGSGVYSINIDAESAPPKVEALLAKLRKDGVRQELWSHIEGEFKRITGATSASGLS